MLQQLMAQFYNYLSHLVTGLAVLWLFAFIYLRITPYDEIRLIREGRAAAALSFGGALIGFALTFASSVVNNPNLVSVLAWALLAMLIQVATFFGLSLLLPGLRHELERDNVAMGGLIGAVALVVGIINAACLS